MVIRRADTPDDDPRGAKELEAIPRAVAELPASRMEVWDAMIEAARKGDLVTGNDGWLTAKEVAELAGLSQATTYRALEEFREAGVADCRARVRQIVLDARRPNEYTLTSAAERFAKGHGQWGRGASSPDSPRSTDAEEVADD